MKKSNIAIIAILVAASIVFLALWLIFDFDTADMKDLIICVAWWIVIIAICIAIHLAEKKRQQATRIILVSDELLFNSEAGIVPLNSSNSEGMVEQIRETLSNLSYNVEDPEIPNDSKIRFKYIVRSPKFAQSGDVWEGEVVTLSQSSIPQSFANKQELIQILS